MLPHRGEAREVALASGATVAVAQVRDEWRHAAHGIAEDAAEDVLWVAE